MEEVQLLEIYDQQQRRDLEVPDARREDTGQVVRFVNDADRRGFIIYSNLADSSVDVEIDAQVDYFRKLGYPFEWKVYDHDRPPDLRQRLASHGFTVEDPEALLVLDLDHAPSFYWTMELPPIEPITDPARIADVMRMEDEVWGKPHDELGESLSRYLRESPEYLSMFAVVADGRIASAAWINYHPPTQFASLWGGSTLAAYRGRGYYTSLLVIRAREARQRGFRFLTIDASPMSRPIVEKHGFQFLGYSTPCTIRFDQTGGSDADTA